MEIFEHPCCSFDMIQISCKQWAFYDVFLNPPCQTMKDRWGVVTHTLLCGGLFRCICGKVMFSQASVILFTEGGMHGRGVCGGGQAWHGGVGGMHGRGGVHGRGHPWQGCVWWGACMAEGVHGKGGACMAGGCVWWGVSLCMAGETTTAADGTHPTGMHSC